jgi:hypothetical protein
MEFIGTCFEQGGQDFPLANRPGRCHGKQQGKQGYE